MTVDFLAGNLTGIFLAALFIVGGVIAAIVIKEKQ